MRERLVYMVLGMLVLSLLPGTVTSQPGGPGMAVEVRKAIPVPVTPAHVSMENFTKLRISPSYGNLRLQPGESGEITFTVKNRDKKPVTVSPYLETKPYDMNVLESEWVTITPTEKEIPAGGSQEFRVKVSIPKDASVGFYNSRLFLTDEKMPQSPYYALSLSVDVWTPPKVRIDRPYIYGQLEAGKEYDYTVTLKNTADKPIPINPKLSSEDRIYGPFGALEPPIPDSAITITSPSEIPAGSSVEVKIHIKVPEDAKGSYSRSIDLGIPEMQRFGGSRIQLSFGIWRQPTEPFVKTFNIEKENTPVTIEVSSSLGEIFSFLPVSNTGSTLEPSFTVDLTTEDGTRVELTKTKTVIQGGVSLGSMGPMLPPWESESQGIYQEITTEYTETYTAQVPAGNLKLSIMPQNTQRFRYTITMGD